MIWQDSGKAHTVRQFYVDDFVTGSSVTVVLKAKCANLL